MRYVLFLGLLLVSLPPIGAGETRQDRILVLGDSLSAAHNIPIESGWVALLDRRLAANGCQVDVVNASISGETSIGGATRLPDLLDTHQPSIVIIELGANDGLRGLPVSDLRSNLSEMIELSHEAGAEVLLAGIRIPTNYGRRYTEAFADVYPELGEEYGAPVIPFLLEGIALDPDAMQTDGLHPTAEAQSAVLENVLPKLLPLLSFCSVG